MLLSSAGVLLVFVGIAAWIVPRAFAAETELEAAIRLATAVQGQLLTGEGDQAARSAKKMSEHTAAGRDLTDDFIWQGLEWIPWAGENLKAVRLAAITADELAVNAVVPAASISIDGFKPVDGRFDVEAITDLGSTVDVVAETIAAGEERMSTIDRSALISQVASGVGKLDAALAKVSGVIGGVQDTVAVLPAVLGAEGPRNYLMLFQNNAETRGTGGLPGALLIVNVEDGLVDVAKISPATAFPFGFSPPILPIDAKTEALYGSKIARYIGDITLTPDFPYTAQLGKAFWEMENGAGTVDGVLSFDPVALGYLLEATGPVVLPTGEKISGDNAASLLLNESYFLYPDPVEQDAFFASAASLIFDAVKSGKGDTMGLVTAITRAVDERRLNLWSADPEEQALLAETPMAGILPSDNVETTTIGVYFNDDSSAKLEYYLHPTIEVTSDQCSVAAPTMHSTVTLVSKVPLDAATSLPKYISGSWYTRGHIMMDLVVYGPVGGTLDNLTINGNSTKPVYVGSHLDRPAAKIRFRVQPGQTVVVDYDMMGTLGRYGPLDVRHTPMAHPLPVTVTETNC